MALPMESLGTHYIVATYHVDSANVYPTNRYSDGELPILLVLVTNPKEKGQRPRLQLALILYMACVISNRGTSEESVLIVRKLRKKGKVYF